MFTGPYIIARINGTCRRIDQERNKNGSVRSHRGQESLDVNVIRSLGDSLGSLSLSFEQ